MTVSYTAKVANAGRFGCFTRILLCWKGSVYKLIYKELASYICVYFALNLTYRFILTQNGYELYRNLFESITAYCSIQMSSVPMTFGLGFYVSLIVKRWWDQYSMLPWPDSLAIYIVGLLHSQDDRGKMMRRNIMRYTLLSYIVTLRRISLRVRKRFPTMQHVVDAGLMTEDELKCMELMDEHCSVSKWWMPLVWATRIVQQARQEQLIKSDPGVQTILKEISSIRMGLTGVQHYDTISVPLVYTQVVTLAVYTYFGAALMGAQWIQPTNAEDYTATYKLPTFSEYYRKTSADNATASYSKNISPFGTYLALDLYFPFFLTLQFAFYVGWLKVAETLINPFGEDDDDFELNYIIDRHVKVSYMIVDEMQLNHPALLKDIHWNENIPSDLPYTQDTNHYRKFEPKGSAEIQVDEQYYYSPLHKIYSSHDPIMTNTSHSGKISSRTKNAALPGRVDEPTSDYECVDNSSFLGWWKIKLRRSGHSFSSNSSSFKHLSSSGARMRTKSIKSQRSMYARIIHGGISCASSVRLSRRPKTSQKVAAPEAQLEKHNGNIVIKNPSLPFPPMIVGPPKLPESNNGGVVNRGYNIKCENAYESEEVQPDDSTYHHLSYLTTISENLNSPCSSQLNSRRNSRATVEGIFGSLSNGATGDQTNSSNKTALSTVNEQVNSSYAIENDEYQALNHANNHRFIVEEVQNYEPVIIKPKYTTIMARGHSYPKMSSSKTATMTSLKNSSSSNESLNDASPELPKRRAKMALNFGDAPDKTLSPLPQHPQLMVNGTSTKIDNNEILQNNKYPVYV